MSNMPNNKVKTKQNIVLHVLMVCVAIMLVISFNLTFPKQWITLLIQSSLTGILVSLVLVLSKKKQHEITNNQNNALKELIDRLDKLQLYVSNTHDSIVQKTESIIAETNGIIHSASDTLSALFIEEYKKQAEETKSNTAVLTESIKGMSSMMTDEFKIESERSAARLAQVNDAIAQQHEETSVVLRKMDLEFKDGIEEAKNTISNLNNVFVISSENLNASVASMLIGVEKLSALVKNQFDNASNRLTKIINYQEKDDRINKIDVKNAVLDVLTDFDQFEQIRLEISNLSQLINIIRLSKENANKEAEKPNRTETIEDNANDLLINNIYENNKLVKSEMLKGGKTTYIVSYDAEGKMKSSTSYDDHGVLTMETSYYPNGQIKQRIEYKNGKIFAVSDFNENGEKNK